MSSRPSNLFGCLIAALGSLAILAGNAGAALTFKPVIGFESGSNPSSLDSGDLDGDGLADLVVANFGSDTVSIWLGKGDGAFGPPRAYPTGQSPRSVEVGDLDGDGDLDVFTANANSDDVSVLLNSGIGTFGAPRAFEVGQAPFSIGHGDLNGDGRPDLVAANFQTSDVSVLINEGNANFALQETFPVGSGPFSVRVGDLNNDGKPDLATADSLSDTVSVLLNETGASGSPVEFDAGSVFPTGDGPFSITGSDFNADGKPDLATANSNADTVSVMLGSGSGAFALPTSFQAGDQPYDLGTGDLDGDGVVDIAVANFDSDDVTVLPGLGSGGFDNGVDFQAGDGPFGLIVADLTSDRAPDIATADLNQGRASLMVNAPTAESAKGALGFGSPKPVIKGFVSEAKAFAIANNGSAPLRIRDFNIRGSAAADYVVYLDGCASVVVEPGEVCRARVRFAPMATGIRTASLRLLTNASVDPVIALSGQARAFPKPKVTCRLIRPGSRKPGIRCRVSYPPNTFSVPSRWSLSKSGVTVRRGRIPSTGRQATLQLRNLRGLSGGRYLLRMGNRPVTYLRIPD